MMVSFPRKEVVSINFILISYNRFVENSMVHIVSVAHKRGVLGSNENYVCLILGFLYA